MHRSLQDYIGLKLTLSSSRSLGKNLNSRRNLIDYDIKTSLRLTLGPQ